MVQSELPAPCLVNLPSEIDLRAANDLRLTLEPLVASNQPIVFDASQVERLGTPAIQLLLAAERTLGAGQMTLAHPSTALQRAFQDLGLSETLTRWSGL